MGPNADDMVMKTRLDWLWVDAEANNIIRTAKRERGFFPPNAPRRPDSFLSDVIDPE
jgi:hypothetical protein